MTTLRPGERQSGESGGTERDGEATAAPGKRTRSEAIQLRRSATAPVLGSEARERGADPFDFSFARPAVQMVRGEPPAPLPVPDGLQAAAQRVKDLNAEKARIVAHPPVNQARLAEIDRTVEEVLLGSRAELEEVVRTVHPSLQTLDRARNLYRITLEERPYTGTLESLLDFVAPSTHLQHLAQVAASSASPEVATSLGLAGSGAQGRVASAPADVDFGENLKVSAATADAAAWHLAATLQRSVREADQVPGQRLPMIFITMWAGKFPDDHPGAAGKHAKWTKEQVLAGRIEYLTADGQERSLTLAQAVACDESAFIEWRGPVDAQGTYGEITKMIRYAAVNEETGATFFATPEMGQAQIETSFGGGGLHDASQRTVTARLAPEVAKYAATGEWIKAIKRAYTVARAQNDVAALNDLGPLLGGDEAARGQAVAQLASFVDEVVALDGITAGAVPEDAARTSAASLRQKLGAIQDGLARVFGELVERADHLCGNGDLADALTERVLTPLRTEADPEFGRRADAVLRAHGYLQDGQV